ncbi:hypothetical protein SCUCBS95973_008388 [Sporothrix curviconia]|uniref:Major facilitator superfamily (MFS) profile domain-containing protein n=1 Tax=Sporothrix curviconia TaxID=1260050 RepID=A0ABP0CL63_9PEZI
MSSTASQKSSSMGIDVEKQETVLDVLTTSSDKEVKSAARADGNDAAEDKSRAEEGADLKTGPSGRKGPGGPGRGGMPLNHPMHPSQFSGDKYDRRAMVTLLGCIGVFQDYYETHQLEGDSESKISWIVSLQLFFMFLGGPLVGKTFDNYGPRYLLLAGTFFHVFGLMMASLSSEYYQFILTQGVCSPIGASMLFFPAMTSCISWFFKKRALAFGVIAGGASLGGVIFPVVVARLVSRIGFGWTMRVCAFMILGLLIVANLTITCRLKPVKKPFSLQEFVSPLGELPFALLALGSFVGYIGLFVPISYIVVQASEAGMSSDLSGYLVPILNAASLFGRTIPGHVADKVGRFNTMIVMSVFSVICIFAVWIPAKTDAVIIVFAAMYGFGSGAFISIMPTLVAEITTDMSKLGVRNGTMFAIISVGSLIGSPIGGAILKGTDNKFWGLQVWAGVTLALGTLFILGTRTTLIGTKIVATI